MEYLKSSRRIVRAQTRWGGIVLLQSSRGYLPALSNLGNIACKILAQKPKT